MHAKIDFFAEFGCLGVVPHQHLRVQIF